MKTTTGTTKKAAVIVICMSLMMLNISALALAAGDSLQDKEAAWGKPCAIQKLDNGIEKRFYKYQNTMDIGFRYFVYQNGVVIGDGLTGTLPEAKNTEKKGLPISELSKSFYQNFPIGIEGIERTWGRPVAVRPLEDGAEERYYKYQNTMDIGLRHFVVKNGNVIAGGISNMPPTETKKESMGVPVLFVEDAGTDTVADIERAWGKPVNVRTLSNGMEERYYKFENTMDMGHRMFLFKDGKAVGSTIAKSF